MRLQTYINFRKNNRIIHLIGKKLIIQTIYNIFALLNQKVYHLQPARMAESVDALVSNTSGAIRAGSIPAPGTKQNASAENQALAFFFLIFGSTENPGRFGAPVHKNSRFRGQNTHMQLVIHKNRPFRGQA